MAPWLVLDDTHQQEEFMAHNRFALTNNNQQPKESVLAEVACFMYAVAKNMFLTSCFFFWFFFFSTLQQCEDPPTTL